VRVVVVAVGKVKERGVREAIDDYVGRIGRYLPVEEIELRDGPADDVAAAVRRRLPAGARIVALEVGGRSMTSEGFARWLERRGSEGKGIVAFLIGGAEGLPPAIVREADEALSLSSLTLPHRLARLLLVEQIYRACTILRGEPYAK
jgi:23S rRNA (pseudouridine1915-N3)-methyltransferase